MAFADGAGGVDLDQGGWQSPTFLAVANITDGMVDEGGFTVVGGGTERRGEKWENIIQAMLHVQSAGKAYYIINEYLLRPINISVKTADFGYQGQLENHKNGFETRRGSNFRLFWLKPSRFIPKRRETGRPIPIQILRLIH